MISVEATVLSDGYNYLEGGRWQAGRHWFSDIVGGKVYSMDEAGNAQVERVMPAPSGLGWLPDGRLLAASFADAHVYADDGHGGMTQFADLSDGGAANLNDMIVLPDGRIYLDRYYATAETDGSEANFPNPSAFPAGQIVLLSSDGKPRVVAEDLVYPNAFALTADGGTLLVAVTGGEGIVAFDIQADGQLTNRRLWAPLPGKFSDGICLDAAGGLWVGSFHTCEFLRVVEGGEISHRIATGDRWSVLPTLGGADGRTLFLLTADTNLDRMLVGDSSARVEVARVEIPGVAWA